MKSCVLLLAGFCVSAASAASITSQIVRQNWPWDGKVSINYVLDVPFGELWDVDLKVTDVEGNDVTGVINAQSGDVTDVSAGEREIVWDPAAAGVDIDKKTMLKFTLSPKERIGAKYLVIDLSNGIGGPYTVEYLEAEPEGGFNTVEYKTEKLVFRRCRAGTYMMGSPVTEEGRELVAQKETRHKVTLTQDFYLGIFEFTKGQSSRVWTTNVTCSATSVEVLNKVSKSWAYRGSPKNWPVNSAVEPGSLVGRLRAGVTTGLPEGYVIDLPTEAQWEYACRAGTDTAWNDGNDPDYYDVLGTGAYNTTKDVPVAGYKADRHLYYLGQYCCRQDGYWGQNVPPGKVGRYEPNAWGFYDMHGNCSELCVDMYTEKLNQDLGSEDRTDPWIEAATSHVVARGGGWLSSATSCRSASRYVHYLPTNNGDTSYCVRMAIVPEKK